MSRDSRQILQKNPLGNYLAHQEEILEAVHDVMASGWYVLGDQVAAFEEEFAAFIGTDQAVGVASGTDAISIALRATGIARGDAVLTVSHTAVATVAAIELVGAVPIFVDIDPATYVMDPNLLERALATWDLPQKPRAIVPVHLYGQPTELSEIMRIAADHGLVVIEDCAQAHGARTRGRRVGSWGAAGAFSFYPTKNLGALGDAGAIVTPEASLADRCKALREYGWQERFVSSMPGVNSRLDELQAAILRVKLRHLDEENSRRREIAKNYSSRLADLRLDIPLPKDGKGHVYHQYVIQLNERDDLRAYLSHLGIGTAVHYPIPVHLQPAYRDRLASMGGLPVTEEVCKKILSLPMDPELTDVDVERVCDSISTWSARHPRGVAAS